MRRYLIITCILALAAACRFGGSGRQKGTSGPLVSGPVSEMVGLASHLRMGSSATDQAFRTYELTMNQAAGIRYLRRDFHWHRIEPTRGNFDFALVDGNLRHDDTFNESV